jgi:hypothetical protein
VSLSFLYDETAGIFNALENVATPAHVDRRHGRRRAAWVGAAMYVESAEVTFDATGVATCHGASLTGDAGHLA